MTNVLLLYESFIPSVRLCAFEQLKYLSEKGILQFEYSEAKKVTSSQCRKADVVILVRGSTWLEESLTKKIKKNNKYIIYIIDDDLISIGQGLLSTVYFSMDVVKNRIIQMINISDILVSPSVRILNKYNKEASKKILIEEPCAKINDYDKAITTNNSKLKIGFAGSSDHNDDINKMLHNVIKFIYEKYKDIVDIEFIGAKPIIVEELELKHYPYMDDYDGYHKLLKELNWDIGLAPLSDTEFNKCKHYNKYIEYACVGCVGVYSSLEPYTRIVENNINGYLCDNTEEAWITMLEHIINHKEALISIKKNISQDVKNRFVISEVAAQFVTDMPQLKTYKAPKCRVFFIKGYKVQSYIIRGYEFIKRNGLITPLAVIKKVIR